MSHLPERAVHLVKADNRALCWAQEMVQAHHYLHRAPDPRSRPFCYVVSVAGESVGCLFFGRTESTSCFAGELTYGSQADVERGRARFDRWEVLNLSRVWFSPDVQLGGRLYSAERLPGFIDRKGVWRCCLASTVIRLALDQVCLDYLMARPPCFLDEPYVIRAALSYCDTRRHRGTIYRAAGLRLARTNTEGVQTWWTPNVRGLSPEADELVRRASASSSRSIRMRERKLTLWGKR